jgi:hypothetical protein
METWQKKIRHLRSFLRGWAKNLSGLYKKEKECLPNLIDQLDRKAENTHLSEPERLSLHEANENICKLKR